jgi:hypothetical protein
VHAHHLHRVVVVAISSQKLVSFGVELFKLFVVHGILGIFSGQCLLLLLRHLSQADLLLFLLSALFLNLCQNPVLVGEKVGDSGVLLLLGSPFWVLEQRQRCSLHVRALRTFFASFFAFFCFCAEAFSILCRRRTGWRLDMGSVYVVSICAVEW